MLLSASGDHIWTQYVVLMVGVVGQIVTIVASFITAWKITHSKKKYIREQISCKKREIWDIQKQLTSIICSGDIVLMQSEYVKQLVVRLKTLKQEVADLNSKLKPKDQDHTKLNVTESIKVLQDTISKLGDK